MSPEHLGRYSLSERLAANVGHRFWKGPDIRTTHAITIDKVANVPVVIAPNNIPPLDGLPPEVLRYLYASGRSRYTQIGMDVHEDVGVQIAQSIVQGRNQELDGSIKEEFEARAVVFNQSARPIYLPEGAHIFRLYYDAARPMVKGRELVEAVASGEIAIEGAQGIDWDWTTTTGVAPEDESEISGVAVRIKEEDRKWIPPLIGELPDPIKIRDNHGDYREEVDKFLVPIPQAHNQIFWVGETVKMRLGPSINAVIDKSVTTSIRPKSLEEFTGIHLNSRLIDAGSNWGVRVEVLSQTFPGIIPHFVHFHFVQE